MTALKARWGVLALGVATAVTAGSLTAAPAYADTTSDPISAIVQQVTGGDLTKLLDPAVLQEVLSQLDQQQLTQVVESVFGQIAPGDLPIDLTGIDPTELVSLLQDVLSGGLSGTQLGDLLGPDFVNALTAKLATLDLSDLSKVLDPAAIAELIDNANSSSLFGFLSSTLTSLGFSSVADLVDQTSPTVTQLLSELGITNVDSLLSQLHITSVSQLLSALDLSNGPTGITDLVNQLGLGDVLGGLDSAGTLPGLVEQIGVPQLIDTLDVPGLVKTIGVPELVNDLGVGDTVNSLQVPAIVDDLGLGGILPALGVTGGDGGAGGTGGTGGTGGSGSGGTGGNGGSGSGGGTGGNGGSGSGGTGGNGGGDNSSNGDLKSASLSTPSLSKTSQNAYAAVGSRAIIRVHVSGPTSGTVVFRNGSTVVATARISNHSASARINPNLKAGSYSSIRGYLASSSTYNSATSGAAKKFVVKQTRVSAATKIVGSTTYASRGSSVIKVSFGKVGSSKVWVNGTVRVYVNGHKVATKVVAAKYHGKWTFHITRIKSSSAKVKVSFVAAPAGSVKTSTSKTVVFHRR